MQSYRIEDIPFSKLPYDVKERLAMYLDCHNNQNWKFVAEALNCPVFKIAAFEERALHSKEASPSLIFFDQFCSSVSVGAFKRACAEVRNQTCVDFLESTIGDVTCSTESIYGSSGANLSLEQKRLKDFDNCSQVSCNRCSHRELCNGTVPLSKGIYTNFYGADSNEMERMKALEREETKLSRPAPATKIMQASVLVTYNPIEKDLDTILHVCRFLKKNKVSVSLDTNASDVKGKDTEEWIREKFQSVDSVIVIATPNYRAATCQRRTRGCFPFYKQRSYGAQGYHVPLIHSLMFNEHSRFRRGACPADRPCQRFLCLLPAGSSTKDIPRWLRSYPVFAWPNHYQALLRHLINDMLSPSGSS